MSDELLDPVMDKRCRQVGARFTAEQWTLFSDELTALVARCKRAEAERDEAQMEFADALIAIETGRQWETIARQLADVLDRSAKKKTQYSKPNKRGIITLSEVHQPDVAEALAAFRALADGATEEDRQ